MNISRITYVVPCYNEMDVLPEFYKRVSAVAEAHPDFCFEFIFIDDGSVDKTPAVLNAMADGDERVKVLQFARNQGHQAAIAAGMDFSKGDLIITIDADLQDPPEILGEILEKIGQGYDVVHMQRKSRAGESWFKLATARTFYWFMRHLSDTNIIENSGDYRAFTQSVLKVMQVFREKHRFVRGLFAQVGFRQTIVKYDRDARFAGETKYPLRKMLRLASNAIMSFSSTPLRMIVWCSFVLWLVSLIYLIKALIDHFLFDITVPGWTSIIILMTFYTGITIFCLGVIATYIGRIFEQGQRRPMYWLNDARNIDTKDFESGIQEVGLSKSILDKMHSNTEVQP